jgi:hypothetical protein
LFSIDLSDEELIFYLHDAKIKELLQFIKRIKCFDLLTYLINLTFMGTDTPKVEAVEKSKT